VLDTLRPTWIDTIETRVGSGDVFEQIEALALDLLEFMDELMPLLALSAAMNEEQRARSGGIEGKKLGERKIAAYFEAEIRLGRVAPHDPEVIAFTFLGALHSYAFNRFMQPIPACSRCPRKASFEASCSSCAAGSSPLPRRALRPPSTPADPLSPRRTARVRPRIFDG
jgi:AcrR family transcriptional regulator